MGSERDGHARGGRLGWHGYRPALDPGKCLAHFWHMDVLLKAIWHHVLIRFRKAKLAPATASRTAHPTLGVNHNSRRFNEAGCDQWR